MRLRPKEHVADLGVVLYHAAHDALEVRAKPQFRNLLELIYDNQHPAVLRTEFLWQFKSFAELRDTRL